MAPAANTATAKTGNKRRAPMSCDRCKSRKTKFCASISAPCHLDPSRRRQRPYYHVSEEEFRYMTKALEHFLPNVELNLQSLREVVQSLEAGAGVGLAANVAGSTDRPALGASEAVSQTSVDSIVVGENGHGGIPSLTSGSSASSAASVSSVSSAGIGRGGSGGSGGNSNSTIKTEDAAAAVSIDEIDALHGELGWLRVDSRGTYRHVGADSGYGFHAAVRSLKSRRGSAVGMSLGGGHMSHVHINAPYHHMGCDGHGHNHADLVPGLTSGPPLPPPSSPDSASAVVAVATGGVGMTAVATGGVQSPPLGPQSPPARRMRMQIFLPRRDLCNRCVSRFFRDIQSIYWFWSAERFYAALDRLYAGDPASATPAMLCSLYSVLALTCESEAQQVDGSRGTATSHSAASVDGGPPPAGKYLSLAKALVPALADEADADSVRALCLLALALQSSMYNNTAYVYVGAAARIAMTLGLHLQRVMEPKGCLQRQIDLRLYSTLFLLDLDIALCYGNPPALAEEQATSRPHELSEQILSPGSHMPLDYLTVSCQLVQIKRYLSKLLYSRPHAASSGQYRGAASSVAASTSSPASSSGALPVSSASASASSGRATSPTGAAVSVSASAPAAGASAAGASAATAPPRPSVAAVNESLAVLRRWYASIPSHLRDVTHAPSFHQRSVAVLHLRYWSATMFATRPFLLYSALHAEAYAALPAAKRASYDEFCAVCVDSARQSLAVVGVMRDAGLLSALVTLDTGCILEDLQVFLLAVGGCAGMGGMAGVGGVGGMGKTTAAATAAAAAPTPYTAAAAIDDVRVCLRTLQGMEPILWARHALEEVMAQLEENGLINGDNNFSPQGVDTPGNFFLDIQEQQEQLQPHAPHQQPPLLHAPPSFAQQSSLMSGVMEAYFSDLHDPFFPVHDDTPMLSDSFHDGLVPNDGLTI